MGKRYLIVTSVIFVVLTVLFLVMRNGLAPAYQFAALEGANIIMAGLALSSYLIVNKQMDNRPEAFVRGVYGASFLKLMVCMISILVYVLLNRTHIHKPTVFALFGIYAIYTAAETWQLQKMARD